MSNRATSPRRSWRAAPWITLLALALLVLAGCSNKAATGAAYPDEVDYAYAEEQAMYDEDYGGDYGEGGAGGGAVGYDFEDDVVDAEMEAAADYGPGSGANYASRSRSKQASLISKRSNFREQNAPPAPPKDAAKPEPKPEEPAGSKAGGEEAAGQHSAPKQVSLERKVIYTATMAVSVYKVEHAAAEVEAIPERFGGWLQQRRDNQFVLRVPAERLEEVMEFIAELGVVDQRTLQALDVTAQYTDLASRIKVLEEMQAQLKKLLAQSKSVEQSLEIRKALDAVTMELEVARSRMRELAKSIAFSTLVVGLSERGPEQVAPSSNDPFGWVDDLGVEATEYR